MKHDDAGLAPTYSEFTSLPQPELTYEQWAMANPDADYDLRTKFAESEISRDAVIENVGAGPDAVGVAICMAWDSWVADKWGDSYRPFRLKPITQTVRKMAALENQ